MNIQKTNSPQLISFNSYNRFTCKKLGNNKMECCISESHLMRNFDTSFFAADYTTKTFPKGTNVVVGGCSQMGAYTYGILLHPSNQNKQYKIIGCDLVPEVIKDAKLGVLNLGIDIKEIKSKSGEKNLTNVIDKHEFFLLEKSPILTPQQKIARTAFEECFQQISWKWKIFNIQHPSYKKKVKNVIQLGQDIELATKRLEYIHFQNRRLMSSGIDFVPKDRVFDNVISFKVDDILNMDKQFKPNSVGLVSCENMIYHLLDSRLDGNYNEIDLKPVKILFEKTNKILQKNGLLVLGTLTCEHLVKPEALKEKLLENAKKNEKLYICDSPIHKLLLELGFEPVHYGFEKVYHTYSRKPLGIYLPSVWKKVRNII